MEGYLHLRINPLIRRLMTRIIAIVPAVLVILINGEENIDRLLIFSQVILSLQLGFAIIPLIHFTSDKKKMGKFAIKPIIIILASLVAAILVYLNLKMVLDQVSNFFNNSESISLKIAIFIGCVLYIVLLIIAIAYPILYNEKGKEIRIHPEAKTLNEISIPTYKSIAVALDFSENDHKLIAHALGQGREESKYIFIHVVESPSTRFIGKDTDDMEARKDQERLDLYVSELKSKGYNAIGLLGFNGRVKEIVRLVKESGSEILVIGAHGHSGIKDVVYGETVDSVRHEVKIPVLVVNL
jgi:manganese transport protein